MRYKKLTAFAPGWAAVDETNIVLDTADQDPFMNQNSPDYYAPHTEWGNPLKPVSWRYPEHDDLPVRLLDFSYGTSQLSINRGR